VVAGDAGRDTIVARRAEDDDSMPDHRRCRFARGAGAALAVLLSSAATPALPADRPVEVLSRHGMSIRLSIDYDEFDLTRDEIIRWLDIAVEGLHSFYGRLPIDRVFLVIDPFRGRGVGRGITYGHPSPRIELTLGTETRFEDLLDDWKMTHEFLHLTLPRLSRDQAWLDEGVATYVEPLARYKVGNVDEEKVWKWLVEGVPNAFHPGAEGGLDGTQRWATIYWGGALFCLLADVEIRKATGNEKGLRDALSGLVARGRVIGGTAEASELLREADDALGTDVLARLYEDVRRRPFAVDLPELWERLGVVVSNGAIAFDENAELADIRRGITRR
jgi:hypothetical protein